MTARSQFAVPLLPTDSANMVFPRICAPSLPLQDTLSLKASKEHKPAFPKEPMKTLTRVEKFGRKILNRTHNTCLLVGLC